MLKLDNVEFPKEKDKNGVEVVATIDTFLAPLIEKLALAHPEWQFKSHYCRKYYGGITGDAEFAMVVERVQVVDKYEALGEIGSDYTSKGKRFWVNNHRTEKMRERGSGMKTIHLDKACKHVDKFFGRMNHDEKLELASREVNQAIYQACNSVWFPLRQAWNQIEDVAKMFVVDNLDTFKSYTQTNSTATTKQLAELDKFPELMQESKGMEEMKTAIDTNKHTLVLLDGMNYIVKQQNWAEIKTSEELPDYVRRGVGMLKLVEVGHAITNIGIRVNDTTFALLTPNNVM